MKNEKFKGFKGFIVGVIVTSIVASSLFSFAEMQSIEAFFNDIKIRINGKVIDTGNDKPFIYNGRTYLPARYVAEGLGGTVKWNESSNTVEIDRPVPTPIQEPISVSTIKPIPAAIEKKDEITSLMCKSYINLDGKLYYYESSYDGSFIDSKGKYYMLDETCINLLAISYGDYKMSQLDDNPFIGGILQTTNRTYEKIDTKYLSINESYKEIIFNNKDNSKVYPPKGVFSNRKGYENGAIIDDGHNIRICVDDLLNYFNIKYKIEVNKPNKSFIISFPK